MKVIDQALLEKVIIERSHVLVIGARLWPSAVSWWNLSLWWCYHHGCFGSCKKRCRIGDRWNR